MHVKSKSGVYEVADKDERTVYIGSAKDVRARVEEHLMERPASCIRLHAAMIRVEYTADYKFQEQHLRALFRNVNGRDPKCH
jgi:excinuclease UvrABC nuclease subunit